MTELADMVLPVVRGILLTAGAVLWTVLLVRIVGLRSFSKMTAFDFVTTVAAGSLIAQAGTRADWSEYGQTLAAIAGVFLIQYLLGKARRSSQTVETLITNDPVLLAEDGRFFDEALAATRISRANVIEKVRQANATGMSDVRAAVLETTGEISILHGPRVDPRLLDGVRRVGAAKT
jgi:uncharacterized membrane protein YcaP (DUF421 family)